MAQQSVSGQFIPGSFIPGTVFSIEQPLAGWWFAFAESKLLVYCAPACNRVPHVISLAEVGVEPIRTQFLGTLDGQPCYSAELAGNTSVPDGMALQGLRELYGVLDDTLFAIGGRAVQIVDWDRNHLFCGRCATPMIQLAHERAKRCPACGLVNYPRLSPAVIVLIARGDELLLARAPRFPAGMYGLVAGFVEPGESLEETIVREVREEVGIEIKAVTYFGSQPWPFPNSLMIGFTAEYAGGEIVVDHRELEDAAWFHRRQLPKIPPKLSIARKLIDWFVSQPQKISS